MIEDYRTNDCEARSGGANASSTGIYGRTPKRFILVSNLRGSSTLRALRRLNHARKAAVRNEPHQRNENINAASELGRDKGRDNAHEIKHRREFAFPIFAYGSGKPGLSAARFSDNQSLKDV